MAVKCPHCPKTFKNANGVLRTYFKTGYNDLNR
jgi:hypothetical protein